MKCLQCGGKMTKKRQAVKYDACGLSGITLLGVEVRQCPDCGEREVVIPYIESLHRVIAKAVVEKRERLSPEEIVFLRKYLGWDGVTFAAHIGATPETVSRWERGHTTMGAQADRLLRMMVLSTTPQDSYSLDSMKDVAEGTAPPIVAKFKARSRGWQEAA